MKKLLNGLLMVRSFILRVLEEIVPFFFYWMRAARKRKSIFSADFSDKNEIKLSGFSLLSVSQLESRLEEEHERAKAIDEKTIKFSMTISIALTIVGSASSVILKTIEIPSLQAIALLSIGLSVIFTISGGMLSLGALKTLETFGYGTEHLIQKEKDNKSISIALLKQEELNIVRVLRNEATFQCLRNGFLLLLLAFSIYASTPVIEYFQGN
jgi:hypothetical protein